VQGRYLIEQVLGEGVDRLEARQVEPTHLNRTRRGPPRQRLDLT
jgi:hypothetical protein